jgi:glycerate-2-kinase
VFKNRAELISHGFVEGRKKVLDIAEHTLKHVDPRAALKHYVKIEDNRLQVGEDVFDLTEVNKIYAIGGGKATYPLAVALESSLFLKRWGP